MSYLTQQDVNNFGPELVDFSQRAAVQAVSPHLQELERQNAELSARLAREVKRNLDAALERAVPEWRQVNNDPRFHQWLRGRDVLSGEIRQCLLDEAVARADAARVINFFRGFLQEASAAPGQGQAQPQYAAAGKRLYSRAQIAEMARRRRKGEFTDAQWLAWEHELIAAGREGRILNPVRLDGSA